MVVSAPCTVEHEGVPDEHAAPEGLMLPLGGTPQGAPVNAPGSPKGSRSRLAGLSPDTDRPSGRSVPGEGLTPLRVGPAEGLRVHQ